MVEKASCNCQKKGSLVLVALNVTIHLRFSSTTNWRSFSAIVVLDVCTSVFLLYSIVSSKIYIHLWMLSKNYLWCVNINLQEPSRWTAVLLFVFFFLREERLLIYFYRIVIAMVSSQLSLQNIHSKHSSSYNHLQQFPLVYT